MLCHHMFHAICSRTIVLLLCLGFGCFCCFLCVFDCGCCKGKPESDQVLEVLKKNMSEPVKPFPQHAQYVREVEKTRADQVDRERENVHAGEPMVAPCATEPSGVVAENGSRAEEPGLMPPSTPGKGDVSKMSKRKIPNWNYGSIRSAFIQQRKGEGISFRDALKLWDASQAKKVYLGKVSVSELKKRRFLPKGATTNPWSTDS